MSNACNNCGTYHWATKNDTYCTNCEHTIHIPEPTVLATDSNKVGDDYLITVHLPSGNVVRLLVDDMGDFGETTRFGMNQVTPGHYT